MKIITIVDNNLGIAFNHRRQSRDSELIKHLTTKVKDNQVNLTPLSFILFSNCFPKTAVKQDIFDSAGEYDYVLAEDRSVKEYEIDTNEIIVYRWNTDYPADTYFDIDLNNGNWKKIEEESFEGSSHDKITYERWIK